MMRLLRRLQELQQVSSFTCSPSLKYVFQAELHFPHGARRGHFTKRGRSSGVSGRVIPIRMIGEIEGFETELQGVSFAYPDILQRRKVPLHDARCEQYISSHVAELIRQARTFGVKSCNVPKI